MCEHVKVMEEAFFESYGRTKNFSEALEAAYEAAKNFHVEEMSPDEVAAQKEREEVEAQVLMTLQKEGLEAGIKLYEERYVAELDAGHAQTLSLVYGVVNATHDAYHRHGRSKVRTTVEAANQLMALAIATGPEMAISILAALLVDLVACPEAHAALVACREAVPAGLEDLKGE